MAKPISIQKVMEKAKPRETRVISEARRVNMISVMRNVRVD
jgi:hypothetical protein